jgi:hypothetical protein
LGIDTVVFPSDKEEILKEALLQAKGRGVEIYAHLSDVLQARALLSQYALSGLVLEGLETWSSEETEILFGFATGFSPEEKPKEWQEFRNAAIAEEVRKLRRISGRIILASDLPIIPISVSAIEDLKKRGHRGWIFSGYGEFFRNPIDLESIRRAVK